MGFSSVVVVANDALSDIKSDPKFGASLSFAVASVYRGWPVGVPAHGNYGVFCNAVTVVSTAHADVDQVCVVRGNTGYVHRYGHTLPDAAVDALKRALDDLGYSVRKKRVKPTG